MINVSCGRLEYYLDSYKEALEDGDKEWMNALHVDLLRRIDGVCLCYARSSNECTCGAWDDRRDN